MNRAESSVLEAARAVEQRPGWPGVLVPASVAVGAVALVLLGIVAASRSAWMLLGAGRGLIPEEYFHVWGYVITLGTTLGQLVGWAGGSALGFWVLTRLGLPASWFTARLAMSVVYVGLGAGPLFVYHALFGDWLLGLPREGLAEWLSAHYPDAYWLLITAHPWVDVSLAPLGVIFLGLVWGAGEALRGSTLLQTVAALAVSFTSLAVALSLAIHSTLVHIRLG
jgi:hypothetical protein